MRAPWQRVHEVVLHAFPLAAAGRIAWWPRLFSMPDCLPMSSASAALPAWPRRFASAPPAPAPRCCRTALVLYRQILDAIEANDYNNFTQRAYVRKWRKLVSLPEAFMRASMRPALS